MYWPYQWLVMHLSSNFLLFALLTLIFHIPRWTQTNTRASVMAFQWQWGKMVSEAWQRAGLLPLLATPCRDCASLASTKCSRSCTVICWERWGLAKLYTELGTDKKEYMSFSARWSIRFFGDEKFWSSQWMISASAVFNLVLNLYQSVRMFSKQLNSIFTHDFPVLVKSSMLNSFLHPWFTSKKRNK